MVDWWAGQGVVEQRTVPKVLETTAEIEETAEEVLLRTPEGLGIDIVLEIGERDAEA